MGLWSPPRPLGLLFCQLDQERCLEGSQTAGPEDIGKGALTEEGLILSNNPVPSTTQYTLSSQTPLHFQAKSESVLLA